jgi:hypothetical protein
MVQKTGAGQAFGLNQSQNGSHDNEKSAQDKDGIELFLIGLHGFCLAHDLLEMGK